jgi:ribonuclease P protein component
MSCPPSPFRLRVSPGTNMSTHLNPASGSALDAVAPQSGSRPSLITPQSLAQSRLRKHVDYQRAYAASRKRQSQSMSWFLAPRQIDSPQFGRQQFASLQMEAPGAPRVGLTAGKVLGKAHERNRIKRRMREALRRHVDLLPAGCDLILHPRRSVLTIEFTKLEAEIVRILQQANADAPRGRATTAPPASAKPLS